MSPSSTALSCYPSFLKPESCHQDWNSLTTHNLNAPLSSASLRTRTPSYSPSWNCNSQSCSYQTTLPPNSHPRNSLYPYPPLTIPLSVFRICWNLYQKTQTGHSSSVPWCNWMPLSLLSPTYQFLLELLSCTNRGISLTPLCNSGCVKHPFQSISEYPSRYSNMRFQHYSHPYSDSIPCWTSLHSGTTLAHRTRRSICGCIRDFSDL